MRHQLALTLAVVSAVAAGVAAEVSWGSDFANGDAEPLMAEIREEALAVLRAPESERDSEIESFISARAATHIEAFKRLRNPEFLPMFRRMLDSKEWKLRARALYVLEYYGDTSVMNRAMELLADPQPRMRERAAIFLIKMWGAKDVQLDGEPAQIVRGRLREEESLHVRRCLKALQQRMAGKLHVEKVHTEFVRLDDDGLMVVPIIDGFSSIASKASGYSSKPNMRSGGSSAGKLPVADRWTTPLLAWGIEEVKGASLQPFANPREGGRVHTGQDVGASLEGAGFYSCADGIVRFVYTGSDMGTLIVVQHHLSPDELVNSLYMHGGDTVFVSSGDEVECGQLLGTMGMGFSIENGGHYAHLHHGMYPGAFQATHNYGYKMASDGLSDWYDPAELIPELMERTEPALPDLKPLAQELDKAVAQIQKNKLGKAHALASKVQEKTEGEVAADAAYLLEQIQGAPARMQTRAQRELEGGYPTSALARLEQSAKDWKGLDGAKELGEKAKELRKDADVKKALRAEAELDKLMAKASQAKDKDIPALLAALGAMAERYADTVLAGRISAARERLEARR